MKINGIKGPACGLIQYSDEWAFIRYLPNPVPDWHLVIADSSSMHQSASEFLSLRAPFVSDPKVRAEMEEMARWLMNGAATIAEYLKQESAKLYEDEDV